jgi:lipopolysaccharide export system permease protein
MPWEAPVVFGILHRYVIDQLVRSFLLALLTLTSVIVLFMVMAEATRQGLSPQVVLRMIPYIVPGTLPYTIPVALLFAATVVYGRMAGDNEVMAVKASGCSAWVVLGPGLAIGLVLAVILSILSSEVVPRANHAFKAALAKDMEAMFYMVLKKEREFNNTNWPFYVSVKDVQDRKLISPIFNRRDPDSPNKNSYDVTVQAEEAEVEFDKQANAIRVHLIKPLFQSGQQFSTAPVFDGSYPLPTGNAFMSGVTDRRVQELTNSELTHSYAKALRQIETGRKRQAIRASLEFAAGRIGRMNWPLIRQAAVDDKMWTQKSHELRTERWLRNALAGSVFFFIAMGAPVGILFAKRDFLSAFITCFLPIILIYYPLVLAGINMSKDGIVPPLIVWSGNAVLAILAATFALPPVLRH